MTIGRSPDATVRVEDDQLSPFHALLVLRDEGHEVRDLRSPNGTYVNGKRLELLRLLNHGDQVRIGTTTLRYVIEKPTERCECVPGVSAPPL